MIGKQRLKALLELDREGQFYAYDPYVNEDLENVFWISNETDLLTTKFDFVNISVPHDVAFRYTKNFLESVAKVLLEKPMGINLEQSKIISKLKNSQNLSIGFIYRFMPGIVKIKEIIDSGEIGDLISVRFSIGHGGKPADRDNWKFDPIQAGGGALLDPGIHILDLINFLLNVNSVQSVIIQSKNISRFLENRN